MDRFLAVAGAGLDDALDRGGGGRIGGAGVGEGVFCWRGGIRECYFQFGSSNIRADGKSLRTARSRARRISDRPPASAVGPRAWLGWKKSVRSRDWRHSRTRFQEDHCANENVVR